MSKYSPKYGRVDNNQSTLVKYLRSLGASVVHTSNVHKGMSDLVIGWQGENYLAEIKDIKGKQTKDQIKFESTWKGQYTIIRTKEDVDKLLGIGYN